MHTSELYRKKKKKKELYKKHVCKLKNRHISVYFWTKICHNTREEWTAADRTQAKYEHFLEFEKITQKLLCFLSFLCTMALPGFSQKCRYHTVWEKISSTATVFQLWWETGNTSSLMRMPVFWRSPAQIRMITQIHLSLKIFWNWPKWDTKSIAKCSSLIIWRHP